MSKEAYTAAQCPNCMTYTIMWTWTLQGERFCNCPFCGEQKYRASFVQEPLIVATLVRRLTRRQLQAKQRRMQRSAA